MNWRVRASQNLDRFNDWVEHEKIRIMAVLLTFATAVLAYKSLHPEPHVPEDGVSIRISSQPPGARIFLFSEDTGLITPAVLHLDPSRPYVFDLIKDGFDRATLRWDSTLDTSEISIDLKSSDPD